MTKVIFIGSVIMIVYVNNNDWSVVVSFTL